MHPPLSYIIWNEGPIRLIGFNRYESPGYVDCGSKWSVEDKNFFQSHVLAQLTKWISDFEFAAFTHEIMRFEGLEEKLALMGIGRQEAEWFWND